MRNEIRAIAVAAAAVIVAGVTGVLIVTSNFSPAAAATTPADVAGEKPSGATLCEAAAWGMTTGLNAATHGEWAALTERGVLVEPEFIQPHTSGCRYALTQSPETLPGVSGFFLLSGNLDGWAVVWSDAGLLT